MPINSFLPSAAKVPVSGLSTPIFIVSAARALQTKGEANCAAPATAAALMMVRRSSLVEMEFLLIVSLPVLLASFAHGGLSAA